MLPEEAESSTDFPSRCTKVLVFVNRTDEVEKVVEHLKSSGVAAEGFHRLQGPFRVQRHRRGCQQEFSSIDDENSHQRHPKEGGRSRSERIQMGTPWHVSRGVKDLASRLRDACNGIFPSDVNRVALGGGAKLRSCCRVINSRVCFCRKAYTIRI